MTATQLKAEVANYLRFVLQHPVVAVEALHQDVFSVDTKGRLRIIEVKRSLGDLRADKMKPVHYKIRHLGGEKFSLLKSSREGLTRNQERQEMRAITAALHNYNEKLPTPTWFYFAVPAGLENRAGAIIQELYPYAGLLGVKHIENVKLLGHYIHEARKPEKLDAPKLTLAQLATLVKAESASLANAYAKLARIWRKAEKE